MDNRRPRADNSILDQPVTPHQDGPAPRDEPDPVPDLHTDHTEGLNPKPSDHPPHPTPDHQNPPEHRDSAEKADLKEREDPDSSDRPTEPRPADTQPDPFASYSAELRAHMHHDDTLSRLQYLRNPLPEPKPTEGVEDETDRVVEDTGPGPQPEPLTTADTEVGSAKPASTDVEATQADEPAQEPTADPDHDTRDSSTRTDQASPPDDSADAVKPMNLETEVNGEAAEARVDRWDAERANLPVRVPERAQDAVMADSDAEPMNLGDAVDYVTTMKSERPWLEPVADCDPRIQRIHAAIDLGAGHAHIRHGAMGDDELCRRRVGYLEDPAQLDEAKRMAGVDGFKHDKLHFCADTATRINDATAFAVAYAGVVEHPDVRQVLDAGADQIHQPHAVEIPLAELLGTDGHRFCSGYRLTGDWAESNAIRKEWVIARAEGQDVSGLQEPQTERISSFENGTMMVRFARNPSDQKFYIATMFVQPPPDED
ncbi:hypothetical protein [Kribbella speibonae]|uniref:Uncharacterized protein n=1 Tax=Kribbella speibonae TaxID=1572660 RepID=A0A4R0J3R6_9ACTN|nr:hypothetical protein [Kribbella speibonae]TCC40569.1 hypothetical protein E0H92_02385 [Kribbella speibonae]